MTLEEIKKVLFEKIDAQMSEYLSNKKQFGEYHEFTIPEYAKFCALYDFLEAAGLENEYLEFKHPEFNS